jgi:DNA-binding SARP family transcriptional activator
MTAVAAMIPAAQFVEVPGHDHFPNIGDTDVWLHRRDDPTIPPEHGRVDAVERFVTGTVAIRPATSASRLGIPEIRTMGGFEIRFGDEAIPLRAWGSRRARQLCKRLDVAVGQPVTRDELADALWPGDDSHRLSARLSVQLSAVRRILGGAIIADRASVRLDLSAVRLDLNTLQHALGDGDDARAVNTYQGELLPEDTYEEWTRGPRENLRQQIIGARRRLAVSAIGDNSHIAAADHLAHLLSLDPYDEWAHEMRIRALVTGGCHGEAQRADQRYRIAMPSSAYARENS